MISKEKLRNIKKNAQANEILGLGKEKSGEEYSTGICDLCDVVGGDISETNVKFRNDLDFDTFSKVLCDQCYNRLKYAQNSIEVEA